jgi:hypothetical protein
MGAAKAGCNETANLMQLCGNFGQARTASQVSFLPALEGVC